MELTGERMQGEEASVFDFIGGPFIWLSLVLGLAAFARPKVLTVSMGIFAALMTAWCVGWSAQSLWLGIDDLSVMLNVMSITLGVPTALAALAFVVGLMISGVARGIWLLIGLAISLLIARLAIRNAKRTLAG